MAYYICILLGMKIREGLEVRQFAKASYILKKRKCSTRDGEK